MLKNISLSRKLILIVLAPLLGFLWLGTLYVNESYKTLRQMEYTVEASSAAQQVSQLITTLQRERGASGVFLGSQGRLMSRRLPGLRQATDEASNAVATLALKDDAQLASLGDRHRADAVVGKGSRVSELVDTVEKLLEG